jgi:hypothetical protein
VPGSRQNPASWSDASGNFWLFGGNGFGAAGATGYFNDLWKYGASEWTWVNGSSLTNQTGSYGSEGVAAPGNVPGARWGVVSSVDTAGNFWIFGGKGYDSAGLFAYLNDLWQYSAGTGEWIWRSGSNFVDQVGNYGIEGSPAPGNVPGAREAAVSWTDTAGNFWLFGGSGYDSSGSFGYLNDLWEYSAGEWTWISGSNVFDQLGIYGTQGTASPSNVPGGRINAMGWVDKSGNFWLFGGFGFGTNSGGGSLNDLWKYSAGEWTWMGGSTTADQFATYGTLGTGSPGNTPGARIGSATWIDASGNFWLFGGQGYGSYEPSGAGQLNDLWKYSAGEWTWMGGSTVTNLPGTYGTQGTSAPANIPGSRSFTATWIDASGNFWLFGGYGDDSAGTEGDLNDLWKYQLLN